MQSSLRLLILVLLWTGLAQVPALGQLVVCPGEPVQFELDQSYYGVKTWEYSIDNVAWGPVAITEQEPFFLAPDLAGYYRVRFDDEECNTTYFSNVVQLLVPAPLEIQSFYEDHTIAGGVNPVFWLDRYSDLTDIVYFLNGVPYPSTLEFEMLPNPGSAFDIYATALDATGCVVHSDTLEFAVFNSDIEGTGVLQTTADIATDDIVVTTSIDTVALVSGQSFEINYSLDYDKDMVVAQRLIDDSLAEVVALQLVIAEGAAISLNEESTADALVLSQPDVAYFASENYDAITAWLHDQPNYTVMRDQFTSDLNATGHLDLQDPQLPNLINGLVVGILTDLVPQFMGGPNPVSPELTVDQSQPSQLSYNHDFNNLGYVACAYQDDASVSGAMIFPGVWHPAVSNMTENVKSILCAILQMDVRFELVSQTGKFPVDSLSTELPFAEMDIWLVNGEGFAHAAERDMAEQYNSFIFMHRVVTGWLTGAMLKKIGGLNGGALLCVQWESAQVLDQLNNAPQPPTSSELATQLAQYVYQVVGCAYPDPPNWLDLVLNLTGVADIGFMLQFNLDRHYREPELIYKFTKVEGQWMGKLVVESNVTEQFVGIPGSMTTEKPGITIKERYAHVRRPSGTELFFATPVDVNIFEAGFTFNGLMINTESVDPPGGGTLYDQFINEPVFSGPNEFNWRLAVDAIPPQTAQLNIGIHLPSGELPTYVEGYEDGGLSFTATIEQPVLQIISVNPQTALSFDTIPAIVRLKTQSGQGVNDYPVYFTVVDGEGGIDFAWQTQTTIQTSTLGLDGIAQAQWILGGSGPQVLRASILSEDGPPLAEVDFQADLTSISLAGYTYSVVSWRFTPTPGFVNTATCNNPPNLGWYEKSVTFDESTYMMEIWNEDGTSSVGGPYPYSIGAYYPDSLFLTYDPPGPWWDCTNSYGHNYPEGWGVKIPPGFALNWGTETNDIWPTRISLDGIQLYRAQTGDEVYIRQ